MQTVGEETSDKIRTRIKSKISQVSQQKINKNKIKSRSKNKVETDEDSNVTCVRGFNSVMSVFPNIRAS